MVKHDRKTVSVSEDGRTARTVDPVVALKEEGATIRGGGNARRVEVWPRDVV
jgi:hypothetical protein